MDPNIFSKIVLNSSNQLERVSHYPKKRELYTELKEVKNIPVGIRGFRGVGKTTLLLQLAKNKKKPLYFSMDAIYLKSNTIYDIVKYALNEGYSSFFIDEIHQYPKWSWDIKTLFDEGYTDIYFTGSSSLGLIERGADLSRRLLIFNLPPVSFREYLYIKKGLDLPKVKFTEFLKNKSQHIGKYLRAYEYFSEYLQKGGVLYEHAYMDKLLENSIRKMVTVDLAALREIDINYERNVYRLLSYVASLDVYEGSFSSIASALGISKSTIIRLISDLEKADCIYVVDPCGFGKRAIRREPKLLLPIPLTTFFNRIKFKEPSVGRLREEFFYQHVKPECYLKTKRGEMTPDFVKNKITFEVGGKSKSSQQKAKYIAIDGVDVRENRIPLFMFGFIEF